MSFIEFMLWKGGAMCLVAFLLGCFNLLPTQEQSEQSAKPPDAKP